MSEPWNTLKPSNSPRLTLKEFDRLPVGMVVHLAQVNEAAVVIGDGRCRLWAGDGWSRLTTPVDIFFHSVHLPLLPRLSFALTTDAVRERRKTVTRRLSLPRWWKEGAWFLGVDKIRQAGAQGLCVARCGPANYEPLVAISQSEVEREGFPHTTPEGFIAMYRSTAPRDWNGMVWRLPFSYLEIPE